MKKAITYPSFLIASLIVILVFITAQTYAQLGVAILLYIPLAYLALKTFPRKAWKAPEIAVPVPSFKKAKASVSSIDIDKRAFLKLIGATGISFFLFSLIGRRTDGLFLGRGNSGMTTDTVAIKDGGNRKINPAEKAPTDGYRIAEIDDSLTAYYGFTDKDGAWFIMKEDSDSGSFRYSKGEGGFPTNWLRRSQLKYQYFHEVF